MTLAPGETRGWPVSPGVYSIQVVPGPGARDTFELLTQNANCRRGWDGTLSLGCIALPNAAIVVRNARGAEAGGTVFIRRGYDSMNDRGLAIHTTAGQRAAPRPAGGCGWTVFASAR